MQKETRKINHKWRNVWEWNGGGRDGSEISLSILFKIVQFPLGVFLSSNKPFDSQNPHLASVCSEGYSLPAGLCPVFIFHGSPYSSRSYSSPNSSTSAILFGPQSGSSGMREKSFTSDKCATQLGVAVFCLIGANNFCITPEA